MLNSWSISSTAPRSSQAGLPLQDPCRVKGDERQAAPGALDGKADSPSTPCIHRWRIESRINHLGLCAGVCLNCGAEREFAGNFHDYSAEGYAFADKRAQMLKAVRELRKHKKTRAEFTRPRRPFGYWDAFKEDILLDIHLYGQRETRYQWDIPQGSWGGSLGLNYKWGLHLPPMDGRKHLSCRLETCLTLNSVVLNGSSPTPGFSESPGEGCSRSPGDNRCKRSENASSNRAINQNQ